MGYLVVDSDAASVKVSFGDYMDDQSPNYNAKIAKSIDGLKPIYKRANIVLIYEDKHNSKITWLKMNDSMGEELWPLTHDQNYDPIVEGKMAFIISEIDATTSWANRDIFEDQLRSLMIP